MLQEGRLLLLLLQGDDAAVDARLVVHSLVQGTTGAQPKLHLLSRVEQAVVVGARAKVSHGGPRLHLMSAATIPKLNLRRRMRSFALGAHIACHRHHVQLLLTVSLTKEIGVLAGGVVVAQGRAHIGPKLLASAKN